MVEVTATEYKARLGKYFTLAHREDIQITKNGKPIAILIAPKKRTRLADDIKGVITNMERSERDQVSEWLMNKYESLD